MDHGKKSYQSRWGHARTRTCHKSTNGAARARRVGALARLEQFLKDEFAYRKEFIDPVSDAIAKEALMAAHTERVNRMEKEISTLKTRI